MRQASTSLAQVGQLSSFIFFARPTAFNLIFTVIGMMVVSVPIPCFSKGRMSESCVPLLIARA